VAFFWWQSRAAHPLLDLRFLRVPGFLTANVVAFCAYFATFAVFFFTALFLDEVVGESGYKIALTFLPLMVLMVLASTVASRWAMWVGLHWAILVGCVLFAAGLVLTALAISPHPSYPSLAAALGLCGLGVGFTVVPATSSALSSVPAERSGMAASATNTSREIGAVTGVAVLGALVNAQLHSHIVSRMSALGIPKSFETVVINGVETGLVPSAGQTPKTGYEAKLVNEVISAAYSAFEAGLHAALYLGAALALAAGIFSFVVLARSRWHVGAEASKSA
jgi:predicted MFS family arabinose efflux permease